MALLYLDKMLRRLRDFLGRDEGAVAAYIFGSYARGDFSEMSMCWW